MKRLRQTLPFVQLLFLMASCTEDPYASPFDQWTTEIETRQNDTISSVGSGISFEFESDELEEDVEEVNVSKNSPCLPTEAITIE